MLVVERFHSNYIPGKLSYLGTLKPLLVPDQTSELFQTALTVPVLYILTAVTDLLRKYDTPLSREIGRVLFYCPKQVSPPHTTHPVHSGRQE